SVAHQPCRIAHQPCRIAHLLCRTARLSSGSVGRPFRNAGRLSRTVLPCAAATMPDRQTGYRRALSTHRQRRRPSKSLRLTCTYLHCAASRTLDATKSKAQLPFVSDQHFVLWRTTRKSEVLWTKPPALPMIHLQFTCWQPQGTFSTYRDR